MSAPRTFLLGGDLEVGRLGFGAMRIVGQPGNFGPPADRDASLAVLRRAVELGVTLVDTAEAYGPGVSEELVAEALHPYPPEVVIATKGGVAKGGPTPADIRPDGSPPALRRSVEGSLRRLRVERIDLYQLHRVDPQVPLAESVGALAELRDEGKLRHVGLSNVGADQLAEAQAVVPVASVQNRFNLRDRGDEPLVRRCAREGIAYLPYGPLAAQPLETGAPLAVAEGALARVAARVGATPGQVALAWLLHRAPNLLPIPGTTSLEHLAENVAAAEVRLGADDLAELAG